MKYAIVVLASLIFFSACDTYVVATGTVLDAETKLPVKGASVYSINRSDRVTITDSTGSFKLLEARRRPFPPIKAVISKDGYGAREMNLSGNGMQVYLQKKR
jgi:hypothetical protein